MSRVLSPHPPRRCRDQSDGAASAPPGPGPNAELLIWEAVIRDKLGQSERVQDTLAQAKALMPSDRQVAYWWTLGMVRLAIGDLEEACMAGNEALALDPSDPQGYFLLGTVAEVRGDTAAAIELFEKTFQLAADSNTQLAAVARIRMGTLLQRPANMPLFGEEQPGAGERGDNGSCGYEGFDIQVD